MNKVSLSYLDQAVEAKLNSKSIAVLMFMLAMSEEDTDTCHAAIHDFNTHKLFRSMQDRNIPISYTQLVNSLEELQDASLISYAVSDSSILCLNDACLDFHRSDEVLKSAGYILLSEVFLTNMFYNLSAGAKRLLLYVLKHFRRNDDIKSNKYLNNYKIFNLLNPTTYEYLCEILRVNRHQKIRDIFLELERSGLIRMSKLKDTMTSEIYKFVPSNFLYNTLISRYEKKESTFSVVHPAKKTVLFWQILLWFRDAGSSCTHEEVAEIIKSTCFWKLSKLWKVLAQYLETRQKRVIKNISSYLRSIRFEMA
jgi:hypothetical protein